MTTLSAKGTRLNRKGLETRHHLLTTALRCLADGGPEAASANLVAREAGVTWGTVQHQFGDADGLWAAVLLHVAEAGIPPVGPLPEDAAVGERVEAVVAMLWRALDSPGSRAIHHLRMALPRGRAELEEGFPATAEAVARWDREWTAACEQAFAGLDVDRVRLDRVRSLLPGALRGLHDEQHLSSYVDVDEARRGLVDAVTAYLV